MRRILFTAKHSWTVLRMSRHYLLAVICRSRGLLSANEKEGNIHRMISAFLGSQLHKKYYLTLDENFLTSATIPRENAKNALIRRRDDNPSTQTIPQFLTRTILLTVSGLENKPGSCGILFSGKSARFCQGLYFRMKDLVFKGQRPYDSEPLEKFLRQEFGESVTMTSVLHPR